METDARPRDPAVENRLEHVRRIVDASLERIADPEERRCAYVHLYGVSLAAALLAQRRGLDAELACVAGMLHDLASYESGDPTDHGPRSAERAVQILRDTGAFGAAEITMIQSGIAHHSHKAGVHGAFEELMKDADVLQHALYNPGMDVHPHHRERHARLARTELRSPIGERRTILRNTPEAKPAALSLAAGAGAAGPDGHRPGRSPE